MPELTLPTYQENDALHALFDQQSRYHLVVANSSAKTRIQWLNKLEKALIEWRPRIHRALFEDFKKPAQEVDLVDIYYILREIRHTRKHLRKWMRPVDVPTPFALIGARSRIYYEPKGMSLIISPWNYPINLTLSPLVSALAAGCTAVLKPSEHTPMTSALMKEMIGTLYGEEHVAVVEGGAAVAQSLLGMPFHHIYFTGSTRIGKVVMEAAARTMASVTLELGGKCPAVVDASARITRAAHRILQTKFVNAGQTCVAPDYVLVQSSVHDALIASLESGLQSFYPTEDALLHGYADLIHEGQMSRMQDLVDDAVRRGARIVTGGDILHGSRKMWPTILDDVPKDAAIMREEIFGPVLPVLRYETTDEALDICNRFERPLGFYVFGRGRVVEALMKGSRAGGSCINHCAVNYYNPHIPFGGINHSGIGKSHGLYGFQAFSNMRSTFRQYWRYTPLDWLHAPYTKGKQVLIDLVLRWL